MRRIAVVTTSRADFGIYRPILRRLRDEPDIELLVIVSGSHLADEHGRTVDEVEREVEVASRVPVLLRSDDGLGAAVAMGEAVAGLARALDALRPDILVVLGDRFEMHAAALAALPLHLPVAHIHGGELTVGAIDDALRHSMTKLSHLHFVTTAAYRDRVLQLGEDADRVVVCGAPSLDNVRDRAPDLVAVRARLGIADDVRPVVVAFHPPTLEDGSLDDKIDELLGALDLVQGPFVLTGPNMDPGGGRIRRRLQERASGADDAVFVASLGSDEFLALLSIAAVIVGNSSAALIEAPYFGLPAVNVGSRQDGRVRGANVVDVDYDRAEIASAVTIARTPAFAAEVARAANPYDAGGATDIVVERLLHTPLGMGLLRKRFVDRTCR